MEGIGALPQRSEKLMRPAVVHMCLSEQHEDEHAWSASSVQCGLLAATLPSPLGMQ